jgi:hypothetical protein
MLLLNSSLSSTGGISNIISSSFNCLGNLGKTRNNEPWFMIVVDQKSKVL